MRRILMLSTLALTLAGGVASADRWHGGYGWRGGGGGWHAGWGYRGGYSRPIYLPRPVIRERYFDYYRRPRVIVEDYRPMAGYTYVRGHWAWNGYEWLWEPGHYQPIY